MNEKKVSGWYYDLQRSNDLTSIKLLANMTIDNQKTRNVFGANGNIEANSSGEAIRATTTIEDSENSWEEGGDWREVEEGKDKNQPWWDDNTGDQDGNGNGPGYNKLLCRSVLTEDFNVTTTNAWTDFGGDPIGAAWDNIAKPIAPYATIFRDGLNKMVQKQESRKSTNKNKITEVTEKVTSFMSEFANSSKIDEYLNKSLVVQGTRFTYYSGTGIAFNNLGMRFTVFPKYVNGKFISVIEQMNDLYPYTIGRFVPFDIQNTNVSKKIEELLEKYNMGGSNTVQDFANTYINWQEPPGGFKANNRDIDLIQPGTLKLKIGGLYSISNLVCSDASFTFSRQMVKNPQGSTELTPLYCDVNLMLKPATKYSEKSLKSFVNGASMESTKNDIKERMKSGLNQAKRNTNDV